MKVKKEMATGSVGVSSGSRGLCKPEGVEEVVDVTARRSRST